VNPAVLVGAGGSLGALARYVVGECIETRAVDTLAVNVAGSFLLGVVTALGPGKHATLVFGTGFCGAFTTFSTFTFETVRLFETGERRRALLNAVGTLAAAIFAVFVGLGVGARLA
jgi:CrcB protein